MTDKELQNILIEKIEEGDCFNIEIQTILSDFKNSGGEQENAKKLLEQLAIDFSNDETLRDRAYDILDIVTGWCGPNMKVWDKLITESITDGLRIEDDESGVLFNHYSFCELVKHIMVKYGKIDYNLATEKLNDSYLIKVPRTISDVEVFTQELDFHWAMLLVHGDMYWTRGIPCNFNNFIEEYFVWVTEVKQKYNLKEPYQYYDK